ncbi:fibrinogen-like protein A [Anopheles funestus]|uniref:fibrinogen-like protein A n=1 Tax=Anopheles funestus TaxID=62324 RepID=UPI0020C6A4F5|nr:fibrinogen-like protein A [Anopheles funestus]
MNKYNQRTNISHIVHGQSKDKFDILFERLTYIKRFTFSFQCHCYSYTSDINMIKINILFAFTLCCTIVGIQCAPTAGTSSAVQGFAFEMIMTKLQFLEDRSTEKEEQMLTKLSDLISRMENIIQHKNDSNKVRDNVYTSCSEVPSSGIYSIQPDNTFEEPMRVLCDQDYESGGWIVFQHRFNGSTDFYRNWQEYKNGFGNLEGEFWLGLDRIHQLTASRPHELVVLLENLRGHKMHAKYDQFEIGDEYEKYVLKKLRNYSGSHGDFFYHDRGMKFSTFDADNDKSTKNCAETLNGAWWFGVCGYSNLNGPYGTIDYMTSFYSWGAILKTSKLMIRPKTA